MPGPSTCPLVMAYLTVLFARIELDGEVRYGSQGDSSAREVISVGHIGPDDTEAAQATQQRQGLAGDIREQYTVRCAVARLQGDTGPAEIVAAVGRAFSLLDQCQSLIHSDLRLGGLVMSALVESWQLEEAVSTGGRYQRVRFDVAVDAWQRHPEGGGPG